MPMGSFFSFLLSLFFFSERTYADGSGIQWVNKPCEGTFNISPFNGDFPDPKETKWCGVLLSVVGNTNSQMPG